MRLKKEGLYVYTQLIDIVLQSRNTHCKAIILQIEKKKNKHVLLEIPRSGAERVERLVLNSLRRFRKVEMRKGQFSGPKCGKSKQKKGQTSDYLPTGLL